MQQEKETIILIIDDEETIRNSCTKVLIKEGYQVEVAKDGISGLQKAREILPDLAIVDLKMPGICGPEVLEELSNIDPFMAKVVITGYPTLDTAVESIKKGASYFLPKPFDPEELRVMTQQALENRQEILKKALLWKKKIEGGSSASRIFYKELELSLKEIEEFFSTLEGQDILRGELLSLFLKAKTQLEKINQIASQWLT